MRRLSLIGSSSHQQGLSPRKSDVFKTLDEDDDSWSINGGNPVFVKPQIERIGDNDEDWFSEAEQRVSEDDSNTSKSPSKHNKRSSRKKKLLLAQEQTTNTSNEEVLRVMNNTADFLSGFDNASEFESSVDETAMRARSVTKQSPAKKKTSPKRSTKRVTSSSCLQFDFTKPPDSGAPPEAFLSEFEATEAEETDNDTERRRDRKAKKDDAKRKQRRSERARRKEEAVDFSESESDFDSTMRRPASSRKSSMLGKLSDEEKDDFGPDDLSASQKSQRKPHRGSSAKKPSSAKRGTSGGEQDKRGSLIVKEKHKQSKPMIRLAPAKKDYESDASRRRPSSRRQPPTTELNTRQQDSETDNDTDDSDEKKRRAIPAQYHVRRKKDLSGGKRSPKRRQSYAGKKPEQVVNAIRRRYSVSSSTCNTDTEGDDHSVMTEDSESIRRSHRRSLESWREKEKFRLSADNTFDKSSEERKDLDEKEAHRRQILEQSRRGPVRSISRQKMREDERSESTRLLGQLLGEPDDSSSDQERVGGRVRRHSLEMGYGQDTVYGTIDQVNKQRHGSSYLPSGLNTSGRRGSQTGGESNVTMRNLMQTLEGSTKAIDQKKSRRKSDKCASPEKGQPGTVKEQTAATSYDKSLDEILKARRLRGAQGRQKVNADKEGTKKFNAMNLLTSGVLFK